MTARIAGARHHEWPDIRSELHHAVMRRSRVLHAEDVMDLQVRRRALLEARLIDAVLHVVRHGLRRHVEDRGLVHVVPETRNTILHERAENSVPHHSRVLA